MEQPVRPLRSTVPPDATAPNPMTFLNPLVLLGLAAAAIPLLIHLFNFRRPRRVEFSSLAFLREVQRSTMQRVRIKQWLLLALRTLAIAALVLAFARPTMQGGLAGLVGSDVPSAVAILVDDSPSMRLRDASGSYGDQAREAARAIALTTDARDEVSLVTTSGRDPMGASPGGAAAAGRVDELAPTPVTGTAEAAVRRARALLGESTLPDREIWVVSDLQASTWVDTVGTTGASVSTDPAVRIVPVGLRDEPNVAIVDVRVVSRIVEAGQPVRLEADLVNHGTAPAAGYAVGVESAGERLAQTSVDLPPGERVTADLVITPREPGWLGATVETEDDEFPDDNAHHFTVLVPASRRILLIRGDGADAGFVATALSPALTGDAVRFDVTQLAERALPSTTLTEFDVVVLSGPVDLSSGEIERLVRFVNDGGGLLFFPGYGARTADYDRLLTGLGAGRVTGISEGSADGAPIDRVDRVETEHPLFDGMFDAGTGEPERPELYRRLDYVPGSAGETTLMRLASGAPFLQEITAGRGSILLLTAAPDPAWTDLPTRGLFLPLLYRSLFLLSSTGTVAGDRFAVGQPGQLFLPGLSEAQRIEVVGPAGVVAAPLTRGVAGGLLVTLDGWLLSDPGFYDVRSDDRVVYRFAANPDAREGDLARLDPDEAGQRLAGRTGLPVAVVRLGTDPERARMAVSAERSGVELWNVFLILALLSLVAETAVAAFWKPEAAG